MYDGARLAAHILLPETKWTSACRGNRPYFQARDIVCSEKARSVGSIARGKISANTCNRPRCGRASGSSKKECGLAAIDWRTAADLALAITALPDSRLDLEYLLLRLREAIDAIRNDPLTKVAVWSYVYKAAARIDELYFK